MRCELSFLFSVSESLQWSALSITIYGEMARLQKLPLVE